VKKEKNCHLNKDGKSLIVIKLKKSFSKISEITGFKKSTVFDTINRFKKTNSATNLPRSGRQPVLSPSDNRYLRLCALRD
jgi:hypothetical protein